MRQTILVVLAFGTFLALPSARAQQPPDSAKQELEDTVRRSRSRIRTYPGAWRFEHRFPRSFMVEPRWWVAPRITMAPRIRWRSMPRARFELWERFDRLEFRPRIQAGRFPGWGWRERGRYRTI